MEIAVIEQKKGKVVACYQIVLTGLNYTPSNAKYFADAWMCAVEDGIVDPYSRQDYTFKPVGHA